MIGGNSWNMIPPVVKNLLIINGLMFLAAMTFSNTMGIDLWEIFGLHYFQSDLFQPYQIVTYMFMHGSFSHIFFNMFAVWMFGSAIENVWGSKRFLIFYLLTGFGAAFLHYAIITYQLYPITSQISDILTNPSAAQIIDFAQTHPWRQYVSSSTVQGANDLLNYTLPQIQMNPNNQVAIGQATDFLTTYYKSIVDSQNVVGASGSLFGILLAFGMMFPNMSLYMMFIPIPIKAKYLVTGYGLLELYSAFQNNPGDNVAHFAHLGGMLFGFIIIKFWQMTGQRWR